MKGINYVIKKTASQLNKPEDQVQKVVMEYWETVYKKVLKLEKTTVTVRHLGNFTISRYKLNNFISKCIKRIRNLNNSTRLPEEKKKDMLETEYKRLRKACLRRNELAILFKENKEVKLERKKQK